MMNVKAPVRVLHLEDNDYDAELVRRMLADAGMPFEFTRVMKRESYLDALEQGHFSLILSDYSMPGFDGGSALALARERCPRTPFVFVSGTLGEGVAIESLKNGAANCVTKNRLDRLVPSIRIALQDAEERERVQQAEEALLERAEFFRQISENVTDLIVVLDLEGRRLYTSPSYQTLFGNESPPGTDGFAEIHPEDRERIRQLFAETLKTGLGKRADFRFLLKDGTVRYIESQGGAIRDKQGTISNVIVVSRDVTKRKRAEENLRASEARFRCVVQTANDAIILTDDNAHIAAWNSAAQRMFGYSEDEVRGQPLTLLLPERYRDRHQAGFDVTTAASASRFIAIAVELHGLRRDGTEFPLELSLSTWRNAGETFYTAILRDITDQDRTRQTLEQLRRQNELLLNSAGEGICGLDREGRITFINPAAAKMLGYHVDEVLGHFWLEVVGQTKTDGPPLLPKEFPIAATLDSGALQRIPDEDFWRKDGTHFSAEYVSTPIREKGECTGTVVVFKDITEKKNLETQFLRAQRLESIGRLAGGIAHDLNNVLSPILMIAPLLGPKLKDDADQKMLKMVEASARRGADLVRQILSFSRGVEGKEALVQIRHLINEQVKVAKGTFSPAIDIRSRISKDLRSVMGNTTQLFQVLMNLCVNAREAMPNGGTLLLEAENVLLDSDYVRLHPEAGAGQHVVLTVSDTGTGIRPEIIGQIFTSFFTAKKQGRGSGLGLSTVLSIVRNHHGHVRVKSEIGKGTIFAVYLPAAEKSNLPAGSDQ